MAGTTTSAFGSPSRLARSDRPYGAALVACLTFVLAIAALRTPISGYQAALTIQLGDARGQVSPKVQETVRRQQAAMKRWLEATRGVQCEVAQSDSGDLRAQLTLIAKSEALATKTLDAAAQRFVRDFFPMRQRESQEKLVSEQRQRLADARLDEELLERDVTQALAELQSATAETEIRWRRTQAQLLERAVAASTAAKKAPAAALTLNPEWVALMSRWEKVLSQRSKLLLTFTRNHPLVAALDPQIAELRAMLEQTPKHLESEEQVEELALDDSEDAETTETIPDEGYTSLPVTTGPDLSALTRQLETLQHKLAAARDERNAAELTLVDAGASSLAPEVVAQVAQPAQVVEVLGGRATKLGLGLAVLVSLLSAGGFAAAYAWVVPDRLESDRDLSLRLPLPLLGTLATRDRPLVDAVAGERGVWWFLRGCESLLVVLVLLAILTLLADSQLSQLLVEDPLQAIGEMTGRWF